MCAEARIEGGDLVKSNVDTESRLSVEDEGL